jgi:hypothetical protein
MRHLVIALLLAPALVGFVAVAQEPQPAQPATAPAPPKKPPTRNGEVYKWVDENGVVHYTDKPPSETVKPAKLPPLQTYRQGTAPDLTKFDRAGTPARPAAASAAPQIQVVTPANDETFHGGDRTVPVAVVLTPALGAGQRLIYMLDGKTAGSSSGTSYAFTDVDRGTHTASVAVVDADGQELTRSSGVTFHVIQPALKKK